MRDISDDEKKAAERKALYRTRLETAISATGKSKRDLAEELKIKPGTFYNMCSGVSSVNTKVIVSKRLGKTVKYLFGGYK